MPPVTASGVHEIVPNGRCPARIESKINQLRRVPILLLVAFSVAAPLLGAVGIMRW